MNNKNLTIGLVATLVVAIIACFLPVTSITTQSFGAAVVTPTNYTNLTLSNQLIVGGADVRNDPTSATLALTDFLGNSTIIENNSSSSAIVLTLPGTSTLQSFIPHQGDYASFIIYSASTTGTAFTIASSSGSQLLTASTSPIIGGYNQVIAGGAATLEAVRTASSNGPIIWLFSPFKP